MSRRPESARKYFGAVPGRRIGVESSGFRSDRELSCRSAAARHYLGSPVADVVLLQDFVANQDETAFLTLLDRHGALVRGVCRSILSDPHAADDAFQATFLALVRKAGSIRKGDSLAAWLYGVATRVPRQMRHRAAVSNRHEQQAAVQRPTVTVDDMTVRELRQVLDEELVRLPEKYRAPLLLCCLEGKSREEAAEELGWSAGSLKGRLERGRELPRDRLARRGLALSAALTAVTFTFGSASAAVPPALRDAVVRSALSPAAAPAEVVAQANAYRARALIGKVRTAFAGLVLVLGAGVGLSAFSSERTSETVDERVALNEPVRPPEPPVVVREAPQPPLPPAVSLEVRNDPPALVPQPDVMPLPPEPAPPREPAKVTEKPKTPGRSSSFISGISSNGGTRIVGGTSVTRPAAPPKPPAQDK